MKAVSSGVAILLLVQKYFRIPVPICIPPLLATVTVIPLLFERVLPLLGEKVTVGGQDALVSSNFHPLVNRELCAEIPTEALDSQPPY